MRRLLASACALAALASPALGQASSADLVEQGRRLAVAGDCTACHTTPSTGAPFAGGYPIASPLGAIYATNITPSKSHGIGAYTEAEFARVLRQGIRRDGAHLYPAMPYTSYTQLSDGDVHALYLYFMQGVTPVDVDPPRTILPFPFNLRFSMAFWNALFLDDRRFTPDPSATNEWNRGAYLVGALGHCSTCHSPRGLLMQERSDKFLAGGQLGEWYAPNITADAVSGVGGWTRTELVAYLKTGRVLGKAQAAGGMAEAVTNSLSHLPDKDLEAIAVYLASVPGVRDAGVTRTAFTFGAPAAFEAKLRGSPAASTAKQDGARLYSGLCASCHDATGAGTREQVYPSLLRNSTVGAARPDNLIAVILHGVDRNVAGEHVLMPGFGSGSFVQPLTDAQIASVATFVRGQFGPGGTINADDVAVARAGGAQPSLPKLVYAGFAVSFAVVIFVAWRLLRRPWRSQ